MIKKSFIHSGELIGHQPHTTITTVAVFGAGISGLSVAHELARLGYKVSVYEANCEPGGFFRSARLKQDNNMPSEYSWHGFGPWYYNAFDIMKQIPFDEKGSVYNRGLSRPIDFGIFPEQGEARFYDKSLKNIPKMFLISNWDWIRSAWLMLKTWTANQRTVKEYSKQNAAEKWKPLMNERGHRLWKACFGPWIGSDWTRVSLHQAGQFFRKQLITRPSNSHPADEEGPLWKQGAGDGWLLLRGPSNEIWFDKWVKYLQDIGVKFFWNASLKHLEFKEKEITGTSLESGAKVEADLYVLAINPFATVEVLARTPLLEREEELKLFKPLTQDGPHMQVSFRIAFCENIFFPRKRAAVVVADSEFNLTLFAQEQVWMPEVELGPGIKSLWTGTSCVETVPGRIYQLPVKKCSKEQFIEEVRTQILSCQSLDSLIKEANGGRSLKEFKIMKIEVWHEWLFSSEGIQSYHQPKWVNSTNTQAYLPNQTTPILNLFLAGAHTKTEADVWSIEGAVESGRRAAKAIDPRVMVLPQYKPSWMRLISFLDDGFFRIGAPHILDLLLLAAGIALVMIFIGVLT